MKCMSAQCILRAYFIAIISNLSLYLYCGTAHCSVISLLFTPLHAKKNPNEDREREGRAGILEYLFLYRDTFERYICLSVAG